MIRINPVLTKEEIKEIQDKIKENDGYCACTLVKHENTKCMCKAFREQAYGLCHCGLYEKY